MTTSQVHPSMSRRSLLKFAGASSGIALAGTLGPFASLQTSAQNGADQQPRSGGTLRVGRLADITAPDQSLLASQSYIMTAQIYNALIHYNEKQEPQPELAESWEVSSDGLQVKISLRKGVQFHTGREFTSEDVKYNTLRVRNAELGMSQLKTMSEWITDIQTPDPSTVIYKLEQPRPGILDLLGYLFIVDSETAEGPDAARKGVGTGPFTFAEWAPGERLRFEKFPNYWTSGRPYLDEIVVQIIKDPQALQVQLESGAVDMAELLPEREAAQLKKDPSYQVILNELSGQFYLIAANTTKPPLDNKKVRQALNYAIDRQYFVDNLLSGIGSPSAIPWPPQSPAYDEAKKDAYPYDLDKAKSLLQEAGVSKADIGLITSPAFPVLGQEGEILQSDLGTLGVQLKLEAPELAVWSSRTTGKDYDLTSATFAFADLEPSSLLVMAAPWRPETNYAGFQSDRYTQLVQSAATEIDKTKRQELYSQLTDLILDESWAIPLAQRKAALVLRSNAHGAAFRVSTTQVVQLENAWIEG